MLELAAAYLFREPPTPGLHVALGTIAFEIASGTLALLLSRRPPVPDLQDLRRVSVLIAAFDEARGIGETVRSLATCRRASASSRIIIADDGSTDGTSDVVRSTFGLTKVPGSIEEARYTSNVVLRLLTLPHRGKGAALNAAMAAASYPVLVTVDADTVVAPAALRALVAAFDDEHVVSATGSVAFISSEAKLLLTRFQQIEFVRNTLIRTAWALTWCARATPGRVQRRSRRASARGGGISDRLADRRLRSYVSPLRRGRA